MMRSLYSAVSGLKTHQTRMDVIGNNISNVNTEAFKSSRVTFSEIMYQTTAAASGGNGATGIGGINAKQIGLGVLTGATSVNITGAGAAETTGNPFDLRLKDSQTTNFFVVSDGTNTYFTRAGSFYVDGNGFLCMSSTGYTLMGWQVDKATGEIRRDTVSALQVMSPENQTSAPEATVNSYVSGVLDRNDPNLFSEDGYVMNQMFYDDLGYSYSARFVVRPVYGQDGQPAEGQYTIELSDILDQNSRSVIADYNANAAATGTDPVEIADIFGVTVTTKIQSSIPTKSDDLDVGAVYYSPDVDNLDGYRVVTGIAADGTRETKPATVEESDENGHGYLAYEDASGNNKTISLASLFGFTAGPGTSVTISNGTASGEMTSTNYPMNFDPGSGLFTSIVTDDRTSAIMNLSVLGPNFRNLEIDFSKTMNYNNGKVSTLKMLRGTTDGDGEGKKLGALTGLSVDNEGKVWGSYDNGNTVLLCQVAAAQFANASGLEKVGDNCYQTTLNSGEFDGIGVEISADGSGISSGELEMSNVDLSGQFTDMIVTQRGFQANSRVITVSDTLLEELINLKR